MKYCMPESDHEEADTRMILHLDEALSQGFKYIGILCVDTDILIILYLYLIDSVLLMTLEMLSQKILKIKNQFLAI